MAAVIIRAWGDLSLDRKPSGLMGPSISESRACCGAFWGQLGCLGVGPGFLMGGFDEELGVRGSLQGGGCSGGGRKDTDDDF
jgi:hypothetical protein